MEVALARQLRTAPAASLRPIRQSRLSRWRELEPLLLGFNTPEDLVAGLMCGDDCWKRSDQLALALCRVGREDDLALQCLINACLRMIWARWGFKAPRDSRYHSAPPEPLALFGELWYELSVLADKPPRSHLLATVCGRAWRRTCYRVRADRDGSERNVDWDLVPASEAPFVDEAATDWLRQAVELQLISRTTAWVVERTICHGDDDATVGMKLGIRKYSVARRRRRGLEAMRALPRAVTC